MSLGTHIFFAGMVTAIFTGALYFTLLAGTGSFIPDIDREYLLVSRKTFTEEQWHRSLFHNLLFLSGLFFTNQWPSPRHIPSQLHRLFITEKDKGIEWLFPFSRILKRGR